MAAVGPLFGVFSFDWVSLRLARLAARCRLMSDVAVMSVATWFVPECRLMHVLIRGAMDAGCPDVGVVRRRCSFTLSRAATCEVQLVRAFGGEGISRYGVYTRGGWFAMRATR